jgi:tetratricopeptide (TPR) repeat protein
MDLTRYFGAQQLTWVQDLGQNETASWHLMRRESDGSRFLLQRFGPRPSDKALEDYRDSFLGAFLDGDPSQPSLCHFGFDDEQLWFLQEIEGATLARMWMEWSGPQRQATLRHLETLIKQSKRPRLLHPEIIGLRAGQALLPRTLGEPPWGFEQLRRLLPQGQASLASAEDLIWERARDLSESITRPIRGRGQELTYVKSLMLGFSAPTPMERIVLLQGEEGVGKGQMAAWACAVAEGDGIWVHRVDCALEESASRFFERLLETLLQGHEADLYAQRPEVARAISRCLPAFAFLTGGRHKNRSDQNVEPEELQGALEALDFAASLHPRLIHLSGLHRANGEVLALVRELALRSSLPWLLIATSGAKGAGLKPLIAQLKAEPTAAVVNLNRLEDEDLRGALGDLLGSHRLPADQQMELLRHSLGNQGLMQNFLELGQQEGSLRWEGGSWSLSPNRRMSLKGEDELVNQIFLGRLQRLLPATAALVRILALADRPIPISSLGKALGLGGDPLEEAVHGATNSKLVLVQGHDAVIPDVRWRELVLNHTPQSELKRLARALLGAMPEGDKAALSVTLQSLASDEATALASVLQALDREIPKSPQDALRVVNQALALNPAPQERSRLMEFLSDAWSSGHGSTFQNSVDAASPKVQALECLDKALEALVKSEADPLRRAIEARLLRKKAMLHLRLRRLPEAHEAIMGAAGRLSDLPIHPEQARIRLALGKLYLMQGQQVKGIRALEEGLQLLGGTKHPPQDQVGLLLELGRALAHHCQFQRATQLLQSAERMLEHDQDYRGLVPVQLALGQVRLAQGRSEAAADSLREALQTARLQSDLPLQAQAHFTLGTLRSLQENLAPAISHFERALERFHAAGDVSNIALTQMWRARTFAALGDSVAAEHLQLQTLSARDSTALTPMERGDHSFLQAEIAGFRAGWRDAARLFRESSTQFEKAGLFWRQRLATLRTIQADAREAQRVQQTTPESSWSLLEWLKGPIEGADSRWLDMEWHRAHALLLSTAPASDAVAAEALQAWGEVASVARDMGFTALMLEASAEGAQLLLQRGERLGARSRIQDCFQNFQQLWTRIPESHESFFLGRADMNRFKESVEAVGLRFVLPERADPLADWTPTQVNLPVASFPDPA